MNDPLALLNAGLDPRTLPPELAAQLAALGPQEAVASALLEQGMRTPKPPETKGRFQSPTSPMEYLGNMAQQVVGRQGLDSATKVAQAIAEKQRAGINDAWAQYEKIKNSGSPAVTPLTPNDDEGNPMPSSPAVNGKDAAIAYAMSRPEIANSPKIKWDQDVYKQEVQREDQQKFLEEQRKVTLSQKAYEIESRMRNEQLNRDQKAELARQHNELMLELRRMGMQNRPETPPVAVIGPDGKPVLVSRQDAIGKTPANMDAGNIGAIARTKGEIAHDQKLVNSMPKVKAQLDMFENNIDELDKKMTDLYKSKGLDDITGLMAGRIAPITRSGRDAAATLNSINAQMFRDNLAAMRAASPTGGAVGNVSDREGDKLEKMIVALERTMDPEDFRKKLKEAQAQFKRSKELIRKAFEDEYGSVMGGGQAPSAPTGSSDEPPPGAVRRKNG